VESHIHVDVGAQDVQKGRVEGADDGACPTSHPQGVYVCF